MRRFALLIALAWLCPVMMAAVPYRFSSLSVEDGLSSNSAGDQFVNIIATSISATNMHNIASLEHLGRQSISHDVWKSFPAEFDWLERAID